MTYDVGKPPDQLFVFVSFSGRLSSILQTAVKEANARIETTTPPHMPKQDQRVILTQNLKFRVLQDPLPKVSGHLSFCITTTTTTENSLRRTTTPPLLCLPQPRNVWLGRRLWVMALYTDKELGRK